MSTGEVLPFRTPVFYSDVLFGEWQLEKTIHFMNHTKLPIVCLVTLGYCSMVYYGQRYMANRAPYDLRYWLTAWNFGLSLFSGYSFYKLFPEIVESVSSGGLIGSLCYNGSYYTGPVYGYWSWMFCMSKGPELLDTLFLVLRKKPIIFLHWYHHSMTYLGGSLFYTHTPPWARWAILINLGIHTVMYFYFGIRAMGWRVPPSVAKAITTAQITQFSSGFIFLFRLAYMFISGEYKHLPDCDPKPEIMPLGVIVLVTYLYLFSKFFYLSYVKNASRRKAKEEEARKDAATANNNQDDSTEKKEQ